MFMAFQTSESLEPKRMYFKESFGHTMKVNESGSKHNWSPLTDIQKKKRKNFFKLYFTVSLLHMLHVFTVLMKVNYA